MFAGWSWSNPRSKITYHKRCCCPTWVRRQINMEFAKVSRKYCNILFRQDGCFRGSTAELLCVTGDATACEQVAGAMPFLTSNRFQIEEIEREREISNQNIGKPSLQSLHERHKDSCTHCSLGGSWQKPWLGDLWAGDLCSRGWTLQGSAIAMKCFKFPQFCILQCLTARSWSPTSNLLRALRPCWYNGLEPVGTGKTVRRSQKSFEIWYFNIRLKIS